VIANMRGQSAEEVAGKILASELLRGLQGPTISPVFTPPGDGNGAASMAPDLFGTTICVPKKRLYAAVNELRKVC
jgi:ATP phosphoribosyltransferase